MFYDFQIFQYGLILLLYFKTKMQKQNDLENNVNNVGGDVHIDPENNNNMKSDEQKQEKISMLKYTYEQVLAS